MNALNHNRFTRMGLSSLASALLTLAFYAALSVAGMTVSTPAQALHNQCKWENGPGAPTYKDCKEEDCLESGGFAMCTKPELQPSEPLKESEVDGGNFGYAMCDMGGPSIPRIAQWCAAQGGTWVVTGASTQECRNLPSVYPSVTRATNEGAATAAGNTFANMPGSNCPYPLSNDTGWGLSDPTDQNCWSGSTVVQNGEILRQIRRQDFEGQAPCNGGVSIKYLKHRALVCPNEYAMRRRPNGDYQCFIPLAACCAFKNPVDFATGAKLTRETDYRAADGLEFSRFYHSQARFRPDGTGGFISGGSDYWRTSYSQRLLPVSGNAYVIAYLQRPDGTLSAFDAAGAEIHNRSGAADRLQSLGGGTWQLTLADSDVENYDASGRLISIVTRGGKTTSLAYDTSGRLSTVTNAFGRTLTLAYDTSGLLATVTLPGGSQITYGYDSRQRPVTVTYPDSTWRTYHYENARFAWLLTGITDESGTRYATYTYSDQGYVQSEEHAGGVDRTTFSFGDPKQPYSYTYFTDALGRQRSYLVARAGGVFKIQAVSEYSPDTPNPGNASFDDNGNYVWRSDLNGRSTNYVYDLTRNLETSRTEGLGYGGAANAATRTTTTQWHSTMRLPMQIDVYSGTIASGNPLQRTTFTRDSAGNVLTRTISEPATSASRTWTYTYDSLGNVLTEDGPRTDVADLTTFTYDNCSTSDGCGLLASVTNALGQVTTYDSYNAHGQPLQVTDPNGVVTTLEYDARQRLTDRCVGGALPACAGGELTHMEYWPTGLLKKVTQPDGSFLLHTYDGAHRLTQIEDGLGNRVAYVLDAMGNRTSENAFDPYGTLLRSRQSLYNTVGQLWQILTVSRTDSQATVFGYDQSGNQTSVNGPMYRTTTNTYDALNRLVQSVDPAQASTIFGYDANDNLTSVTDPRGRATLYSYSGLGDLHTQVSPDTGTTTHTFDSGGNLKTSTDARESVTTYSYDALNRVETASFKIGSTTDLTTEYTYDAGIHGKGRLTGARDAHQSLSWTYDSHGRVLTKTQAIGANAFSVGYEYSNGTLATLTTPSGKVVSYGYSQGRVASISVDGMTVLNNVSYDPFGPTTGWSWGNNTLAVRAYDLDGRLTLIDSAGLSVYTYHDDGSIASRNDDVATSFAVPTGTSNATIEATSNRVVSITGALTRTYDYDASGNTLSNGSTVHTYYNNGRMKTSRLASTGTETTYLYNALGQRIRKSGGPAGTVVFIYDESGHLLGEYTALGVMIQETVWLGDIPVATIRPKPGGYDIYYVHTDHLNTPRRVSRPSDNALVWRWDSDAYGEAAPNADPDGDSALFTYNLRFPGQYFDVETNLNYNYYRDLDPATGRYVQSDPIGLKGGINTYAYVNGSPLTRIDPFGLCECEPGSKKFSNQTSAARAATRAANPGSITRNLESCGNVCKDRATGKYFTTGPLIGTIAGCSPTQAPCPDCAYWVAAWHTHGAFTDQNGDGKDDYDSENFSPADMNFADKNNVDVYVGTPNGTFKHYPHDSNNPYSRGRL